MRKPGTPHPDTGERAAEFLVPFMAGRAEEVFCAVSLDTQCRVIVPALVVEGLPARGAVPAAESAALLTR
jgi:DNA repair protein RadC